MPKFNYYSPENLFKIKEKNLIYYQNSYTLSKRAFLKKAYELKQN